MGRKGWVFGDLRSKVDLYTYKRVREACLRYNITIQEYLDHPNDYPLTTRKFTSFSHIRECEPGKYETVRKFAKLLNDPDFLVKYENLQSKQQNKCAICGEEETCTRKGKKMSLSVDHCHKTNEVRGLLCNNCNRAIGLLKEDVNILQKAINYLNK